MSGFETPLFKPVISIVGPTASGKSSLAQEVALALDGEVVSADSMQIYRGMDIGTAKISFDEQKVVHHLLDIVDPGTAFSAQQFQERSRECFLDIQARDKVAVLCGGTGFYVQAALEDMRFPKGEQVDNPIRQRYSEMASTLGERAVWDELNKLDSASAAVIHPNNVRRVIRALEMHFEGVSYAEQVKGIKSLEEVVPSCRFGISVDPELLRNRIDSRVDLMVELGLVAEVEALLNAGFESALTAPQAIGYKEVVAFLKGNNSLDQAIDDIKLATRRYAKRQRSWFRRDSRIEWLDSAEMSQADMCEYVCELYCKRFTS